MKTLCGSVQIIQTIEFSVKSCSWRLNFRQGSLSELVALNSGLSASKLCIDSGSSRAGSQGSDSGLFQELCKGSVAEFVFLLSLPSAFKHPCAGCLHARVGSCRRR